MALKHRLTAALHDRAARSRLAVRIALKLRNQCTAIVARSLHDGTNPTENGEYRLIESLASEIRFFVDVGANVGSWSAFLLTRAPNARGLAIEPSPSAFGKLRERFDGDPRMRLLQLAAGDRSERVGFHDPGNASELASVVATAAQRTVSREVQMETLDRILDDANIETVSFLKVDAEGADARVLYGANEYLREGRIGVVQFEYNAMWCVAGSTLRHALAYLEKYEYRTHLLRSSGLRPVPPEEYGEYFGYGNYVAILKRHRCRLGGESES